MKLIEFPEQTIVIAKDQPEYLPLPAFLCGDQKGTTICCWELSDKDISLLLKTKKIWHTILTFNQPLQPQLLSVENPFE